jgi:hypothetical protein
VNNHYVLCPACKEFHWSGDKCKPKYEYQIPEFDGEDEWHEVRAYSFQEAAEMACQQNDAKGDYTIIHYGGTDLIYIKDSNGVVKSFKVEARPVPEYTAYEIEPKEATP